MGYIALIIYYGNSEQDEMNLPLDSTVTELAIQIATKKKEFLPIRCS